MHTALPGALSIYVLHLPEQPSVMKFVLDLTEKFEVFTSFLRLTNAAAK